jgi:hypothetical protein
MAPAPDPGRPRSDVPRVEPTDSAKGVPADPARDYALVCLAALMVVTAVLVQEGLGWWGVVPVVVGGVAVAARWGSGPPLVLLALLVVQLIHARRWGYPAYRPGSAPLTDLLLAWAVLAYVAGHYRLQGLARPKGADEVEPARRGRWFLPPAGKTERVPGRVPAGEISLLVLLSLPLFIGLAFLAWRRLSVEIDYRVVAPPGDLPPRWWGVILVVWLIGLALALTAAVLSYLGWTQASAEEAQQYLQDQLWAATRGEGRRLNRWLVWARLRRRPAPAEAANETTRKEQR